MSIRSRVIAASLLAALLLHVELNAENTESSPGLGKALDTAALAELPPTVFADGTGLPEGEGNSTLGIEVFNRECLACHGREGMGGSAMELVGDRSLLATEYPDKGIGVYWPYGPPLFDYIRRSMPPAAPYSLSNDELYAVIAYLLEISDVLEAGSTLDAKTLGSISMPNRANFTDVYTTKTR